MLALENVAPLARDCLGMLARVFCRLDHLKVGNRHPQQFILRVAVHLANSLVYLNDPAFLVNAPVGVHHVLENAFVAVLAACQLQCGLLALRDVEKSTDSPDGCAGLVPFNDLASIKQPQPSTVCVTHSMLALVGWNLPFQVGLKCHIHACQVIRVY